MHHQDFNFELSAVLKNRSPNELEYAVIKKNYWSTPWSTLWCTPLFLIQARVKILPLKVMNAGYRNQFRKPSLNPFVPETNESVEVFYVSYTFEPFSPYLDGI